MTLEKIYSKGSGFGSSIDKRDGYYSEEELHGFVKAAAIAKKEEADVDRATGAMLRLSRRDYQLQSTAHHLSRYYQGEVNDSYQKFTSGISPLFLRPKSNIKRPSSDNSGQNFGKRVAAAIVLSFELTSMYKTAQFDAAEHLLDSRMNAPIFYGHKEPTISSPLPGMKISLKNPFEEEKKDIELRKKSLSNAGKLIGFLKDRYDKKKTEIRFHNEVDIPMMNTDDGNNIRSKFSLRISTKLFDFGGWNVKYT